MVLNKKYLLLAVILFLSGCTQFQRFNTDKILNDASGSNTANLKLTTNVHSVFLVPNSSCIAISANVVKINNEHIRTLSDKGCSFWSGCPTLPLNDVNKKSIGMPQIELKELKWKYGVELKEEPYLSKEYRIEASIPYTVFIKTVGRSSSIIGMTAALLLKKAEDEYGFGVTFIPEKGKDYQLVINEDISTISDPKSSTRFYKYNYSLLDITNGNVVALNGKSAIRAVSCKK